MAHSASAQRSKQLVPQWQIPFNFQSRHIDSQPMPPIKVAADPEPRVTWSRFYSMKTGWYMETMAVGVLEGSWQKNRPCVYLRSQTNMFCGFMWLGCNQKWPCPDVQKVFQVWASVNLYWSTPFCITSNTTPHRRIPHVAGKKMRKQTMAEHARPSVRR